MIPVLYKLLYLFLSIQIQYSNSTVCTITHSNDTLSLQLFQSLPNGCTAIIGDLNLYQTTLTITQLTQKFSAVTSITGYVWIANVTFDSFSFLSKLTTVGGVRDKYTSFLIKNNEYLKQLQMPNLVNIASSQYYSLAIQNNPRLCLSRTEMLNFGKMSNIVIANIPVCDIQSPSWYCYLAMDSYFTVDVPAGCEILNGGINITLDGKTDISIPNILKLKQILGPVLIFNTRMTNITLNVELINSLYHSNALQIGNNANLATFETPNLKYVIGGGISITGNSQLKVSNTTCEIWYEAMNTSSGITICDNNSNSSSRNTGRSFFLIALSLFFGYVINHVNE